MGMESYFIKICPQNPKSNNINFDLFIKRIIENGLIVTKVRDDFVLGDIFVIRVIEENGNLMEMSLEGCLCWFENGLEQCYSTLKIINSSVVPIQVYTPDNELVLLDDLFISKIQEFYKEKYHYFIERYGNINFKLLPDKPFYDYIEKSSKRSFFSKLFRDKRNKY